MLDQETLDAIDRVAGPRGRSQLIAQAVTVYLDRLELRAAIEDTAGIMADEDYPTWPDRRAVAAWVREARAGR